MKIYKEGHNYLRGDNGWLDLTDLADKIDMIYEKLLKIEKELEK